MNLSLWLLQFEKDPSRRRGCQEGTTLFRILILRDFLHDQLTEMLLLTTFTMEVLG